MTEVATRPSSVPALANTPSSMQVDADDIQRRRLYIGQPLSGAVTEGIAKNGDLYVSAGQDDPDPQVLWTGKYDSQKNPGIVVHALRQSKSWTYAPDNNTFEKYDFTDTERPEGCDKTYDFEFAIPEVDEELPYKFSMRRSNAGAGRKMIDVLIRNSISGPIYQTAFRLWTAQKETKSGSKYWVVQLTPVDADPKNVTIAEGLSSLVTPGTQTVVTSGNTPAI